MASAVHAASPSYPPPPTFSQESTGSSINGMHLQHSALNSFDGPQSIASTPTPTPPASRHQQIMPYGTSNYGQANGTQSQQSTPRHYQDLKPSVQQQHYAPGQKPQIYTYGVEELLRPLFDYDMGQDGMTLPGQGTLDTPTKEQAMAAQRKRNMMNGASESQFPAKSPNGTFFKNISKSAANAVNAISKARFDSPGSRPASATRPMKPLRRPSQQGASQDSAYAGSSQQSMQSLHSETSFGPSQLDPSLRANTAPYYLPQDAQHNGDIDGPPRKRVRHSQGQDSFAYGIDGDYDASMRDMTPTEAHESFAYQQTASQNNLDYNITGLSPLPQPTSNSAVEKQQMLTSLFLDPTQQDFSNHPALLRLSGEDLDIPIDPTAHTALHWAATLARTSLLRALINKGASIYRLNGGGETALIRAALTTNNLDQGSFPELLELLGPTIEIRDGRGRTVLHHIAVSSAVKGRSTACRYYLESLLEFVVRQGSAPNSQQTSFLETATAAPSKSIGLAKFMAEIVNAEDMSGDTALNLAARIGNKSITQQLLEVGANPTIPNRSGLKAIDFGIGGDPELLEIQSNSQAMSLIADTESSFRSELQTKQSLIDQTHAKLRETTSLLAEEKRRLAELQRKSEERKSLRQRIANHRRANDLQRAHLSQLLLVNTKPGDPPEPVRPNIKVGEADAGLEIDSTSLVFAHDGTQPPHSHQREYLATLPPTPVLRARATAYRRNNARLETQAKDLQSKSSELEAQLRKVVSLCTGIAETTVDEMVDSLNAAVQSEGGEDVEVGRVREFLRRVEGVGE
ncbi:regulatory protein SWI6, partial [Lecanoromycetidae sp. Uapishka_2]